MSLPGVRVSEAKEDKYVAHVSTEHDTIRAWVEEHGGQPALTRRIPEVPGEGQLSLEFLVDGQEPELITISWADFFQRFEDQHLAFIYEEGGPGGELTWYFVDRDHDSGAGLI